MRLSDVLQGLPEARLRKIGSDVGIGFARLAELSGGSLAAPAEILAIARVLKLHPSTLIGNSNSDTTDAFLFRSVDNASADDSIALRRMSERLSATAELLDDQQPYDDWLGVFRRGDTASGDEASQNAAIFRAQYADGDLLGPLSRLPEVCVNRLRLVLFTMDELPFDGASAIYRRIPIIFLSRRFPPRMLFSLAHELGHLVAHHYRNGAEGDFISVDREVRSTTVRRRKAEQYAHAFASELLLPRQGVGLFFQALRKRQSAAAEGIGDLEVLILSRYYNVSFAVAAMRCEQLELIPAGAAREFASQMNQHRSSAEKTAMKLGIMPREELVFPPISPFLVELAATKISEGRLSIGRASELLGLSVGQLIDLHSGGGHFVPV
ncbi:MAG: ImmA/IrrE family metallo-endopeptidase [Candidatus Eremiobacteraeota bacterium]|nr:ImmA/IrrE family metallo-endopeptidase [Candidatus Eremiobacteraeota bacterium]